MVLDYKIILGLFLGLVAYCLLYLAKGIEKYAFETVSKRITAIPDDNIKLLFTIITMLVSCAGFFFTQYALVKMRANIAVPCFTSTSIVFATVIGIVFLNEGFNTWSVFGIVLVVFGIILITAFKENSSTQTKLELLQK